mmetsp:Transcript_5831/g.9729  ORF Transcript_5831/g.9729 Transcript_5831/m.9729 type:complete len:524 (-) Transcript_5831:9-1580(-)
MGLCSSKRPANKTNTQKTAKKSSSSICPWQPYQSRSTLQDSFYIPLSQHHINICDAQKTEQSDDSPLVQIPLSIECAINPIFCDEFEISAPHSADYPIRSLLRDILDTINAKHHSWIKYQDLVIMDSSFCKERNDESSLRDYDRKHIEQCGLQIKIECFARIHHPCCNRITCPDMILKHTFNPRICRVYNHLKADVDLQADHEQDFVHLSEYNHLKDGFAEKELCKSEAKCSSFQAQFVGTFGNLRRDQLHLLLYKHPPRLHRQLELQRNIHPFIQSKHVHHRYHYLYSKPSPSPSLSPLKNGDSYFGAHRDDYLTELVQELILNGFGEFMSNALDNIVRLVKEKMNCVRHCQMWNPLNSQEMLALMLFVNCDDIAYDISRCQLSGRYSKWKVLDRCLYDALYKLNEREQGDYKMYMAASKQRMSKRVNKHGFFPTYFCASWKRENVQRVMDEGGIMIELHNSFRKHHVCADVSWLSLFPDECQVLLARDIPMDDRFYSYTLKLQNEVNGIQHAQAYFVPHHL